MGSIPTVLTNLFKGIDYQGTGRGNRTATTRGNCQQRKRPLSDDKVRLARRGESREFSGPGCRALPQPPMSSETTMPKPLHTYLAPGPEIENDSVFFNRENGPFP